MDGTQVARRPGRPAGRKLIDVDEFKSVLRDAGAETTREMAKLLGVGDSTISNLLLQKQGISTLMFDDLVSRFGPEVACRMCGMSKKVAA